jgi:hypothetical protein
MSFKKLSKLNPLQSINPVDKWTTNFLDSTFNPKKPKAAAVAPVVPLPQNTDPAIQARLKAEAAARQKRRGRSSTILSGTLGDSSSGGAGQTLLGRNV